MIHQAVVGEGHHVNGLPRLFLHHLNTLPHGPGYLHGQGHVLILNGRMDMQGNVPHLMLVNLHLQPLP